MNIQSILNQKHTMTYQTNYYPQKNLSHSTIKHYLWLLAISVLFYPSPEVILFKEIEIH